MMTTAKGGASMMQNEAERSFAEEPESHNAAAAAAQAGGGIANNKNGQRGRKSSVTCTTGCNMLTLPRKESAVHFICPPRQRQRWDDRQEPPHVNWGDLFFDLFYVGLAYSLATLMKDSPTQTGTLYFAGCFGPVMMEWIQRMWFDSRFWVDDDPFHRCFEVGQLCLLATAVLHIGTVDTMSNPDESVDMFAFSLSLSLMVLWTMLRYVEVWIWAEGGPEAKFEARRDIRNKAMSLPFYVSAAIVSGLRYYGGDPDPDPDAGAHRLLAGDESSSYPAGEEKDYADASAEEGENSTHIPIYLCLGGWAMSNVVMFAQIICWRKKRAVDIKAITVPMNVDFAIHRYGEWTMLMLGESILSLIVSTVDEGNGRWYGTFYAGVLSAIVLQYLHYRSQPHDADKHALRRSREAGVTFTFLMQVYSGALVMLGSSFKLLLYEYSLNGYDNSGYDDGDAGHRLLLAEKNPRSLSGQEALRSLAGGDENAPVLGDDEREQVIARFYCGSMAIVLVCLELLIISHQGLRNNMKRCRCPETKHVLVIAVVFAIFRIVLIVFIASLFKYVWEPEVVAFIGLACLFVEVLFRIAGDFIFPEPKVQDVAGHHGGRRAEHTDEDRWPNITQAVTSGKETRQPPQEHEEAA